MTAPKLVLESPEPTTPQPSAPTYEEIELRAYQLWQTRLRHGIEGTAEQDWAQAEQELAETQPQSSPDK